MGIKIGGEIERMNGKEMSYAEFKERYMERNQPVVVTGLMDDWRACRDWVRDDGSPNIQFFATHFGKSKVQVADCDTREFTDQKRLEMTVKEFVEQWPGDSMQEYATAPSQAAGSKKLLYLKDWHFVKEYPEYTAYTTPTFFHEDWLNTYLDNYRMHNDPDIYSENNDISCSDYRFVYMGAKAMDMLLGVNSIFMDEGRIVRCHFEDAFVSCYLLICGIPVGFLFVLPGTWTLLHADVFRSYSWSANVCGKKQWLFLSPSQSHLVFDRNMKSSVYNILDDVCETKFPGFAKAIWLECTQEQNDIIFVPSGWYHQEDTISINHNWFNANNIHWVWELLLRDYNEAKEYIEDIKDICEDFEGLCQLNLAANTGMNFNDLFIARVFFANFVQLQYLSRKNGNHTQSLSPICQHFTSNLVSIQKIASSISSLQDLTGSHGFCLDFKETVNDPGFIEFCGALGKTYGLIHMQQNWSYDTKKSWTDDMKDLDIIETLSSLYSQRSVMFIEHALAERNGG